MASPTPHDDGSKAALINGVGWFGASITLIFVATRLYARARLVHAVGWDDYIMVAALVRSFPVYYLRFTIYNSKGIFWSIK